MRILITVVFFCFCKLVSLGQEKEPFNVLFIAVDDLNDWTGFLGGHPDALTPHMDALAETGMVFTNAHTPIPLCNPSRSAILTGFRPHTTGIYYNPSNGRDHQNIRSSPVTEKATILLEYFRDNNYFVMGGGKIYHSREGLGDTWDSWFRKSGTYGTPSDADLYDNGLEWGPTDIPIEESRDIITANWVADQLKNEYDKPFFLACGIFRPHTPLFVPRLFFDRFPIDSVDLPTINTADLDDVDFEPQIDYTAISSDNQIREATRAYLANVNYADSCVGVVMDALKESKYYDNTIVVLWGDHGWHVGEKLRYGKVTLWEESTKTPLIIRVPGKTTDGDRSNEPVNLIDIYPTLLSLCDLPANTNNQGKDLSPLLFGDTNSIGDYSLTANRGGNYAIRTRDWRFISYQNGNKELYQLRRDANEFNNLWLDPTYMTEVDSFTQVLDSLLLLDEPGTTTAIRQHRIPGNIQAEAYDRGGQGVSYLDKDVNNRGILNTDYPEPIYFRNKDRVDISPTNDEGGGFHISHIEDGEWLQYTITNVDGGAYRIDIRVASNNSGGLVRLKLNDELINTTSIPKSKITDQWITITSEEFILPPMNNAILRLEFGGSGFLLNEMTFDCRRYTADESVTICEGETFEFGGKSLEESGSFTHIYQGRNGCDSTVNLALVVAPHISTQSNLTICVGETVDFGEQTLDEAGEYAGVFQSIAGCDSTVNLTLSFEECEILNISEEHPWRIFPNPAKDLLQLDFGTGFTGKVELYNLSGHLMKSTIVKHTATSQLHLADVTRGLYLLVLTSNQGLRQRVRVVKE